MKTIQLTLLFTCLLAGAALGQNLKKGNLVGIHVLTVELKPGVTMEQVVTFYQKTALPTYDKEYKGTRGFLVKGIRGEHANQLAIMWIFPSEANRDRYFTPEGTANELGKQIEKRLEWLNPELEKLATVTTATYTDWVVQ